ncbi:restriction endonuclease subunit S [Stutzerimonas stutzeri]|uniref:Type I restriction modification DNA specificity domain-containing protein n=1 Tax=Stutzerimonas stutzeri TaxID=316 RepID=A0A0D7DZ51_STUST|nr:restriction endonuclease subunit S [Stutzerimonas stutzeri]KIZ33551.1 hypothetical protein LO50_20610 [Stutzerimonas stutzeri]
MSLLAYQQMKPSGIEYVGDIPNDWSSKRLGDLVSFAQGKAHEPYIDDDGDYICVNSRFVSTSGQTIKTCSVNLTPASLNDILMVMSDLPNGRALARAYYVGDHGKYAVNQRVCRITAERAHPRFLFYLLDRHPGLMQNDDGVHQTHLSNADFQKLKLCLPSASEQSQIARFLDHETARIDALIEEQQRLIALLKEKRQAVISHVVTKGLDPTVPMKDSGVEWLGEVPAHWVVSKFGYISSVVRGGSPRPAGDPELFNGDYSPWVTVAEITKDDEIYLDETETFLTKKGSDQCRVFSKGTLLLSNSGATLGVPKILMIDANANDGVVGFENISLDKEYSYLYLATLTEGLRDRAAGSGQPNLNTDIVKSIDVPIPPSNEVTEIVAAVKKLRAQFNFLSKEAVEGIKLLQERRSALISAAVTGKIDVRGWQPQSSAPIPELAQEAV